MLSTRLMIPTVSPVMRFTSSQKRVKPSCASYREWTPVAKLCRPSASGSIRPRSVRLCCSQNRVLANSTFLASSVLLFSFQTTTCYDVRLPDLTSLPSMASPHLFNVSKRPRSLPLLHDRSWIRKVCVGPSRVSAPTAGWTLKRGPAPGLSLQAVSTDLFPEALILASAADVHEYLRS